MFKKPFSFEGRIRRTEYGLSVIIGNILSYGIDFVSKWVDLEPAVKIGIGLFFFFFFAWFGLAQGTKRCHDRGNSGLYMFIPFYGLWMLFADSERGINEYGLNPKGIGNSDLVDNLGKSKNELTEEEMIKVRAMKMERRIDLNED